MVVDGKEFFLTSDSVFVFVLVVVVVVVVVVWGFV